MMWTRYNYYVIAMLNHKLEEVGCRLFSPCFLLVLGRIRFFTMDTLFRLLYSINLILLAPVLLIDIQPEGFDDDLSSQFIRGRLICHAMSINIKNHMSFYLICKFERTNIRVYM